jgi:hypothetical protein
VQNGKLLKDLTEDPFPYLDEAGKKKMRMAHSDLLRKFTDLAFDESAEVRCGACARNGFAKQFD